MKTRYMEFISESRYKTHGLATIKRTIPKLLNSLNAKYKIIYNDESDDFSIYFTELDNETKDILISRCELIGYYPSIFSIDEIEQKNDKIKTIDDFIKYVKDYNLDTDKEIYLQFESWLDEQIETPKILYHICRTIDAEKIKRYGISPKSKHKISFHPDRIYLVDNYMAAIAISKQFKKMNNVKYSLVTIKPDTNILLVRKDPNFNAGFYTTQNITPNWIEKITNLP